MEARYMWETILWRLIIGWECFDEGPTTNPPPPPIENFTPDYLPPSLLDIGGGWSISAPSTPNWQKGGRCLNMVKTTFRLFLLLLIFFLCGVTPHWGLTDIRISFPFSSSNPRAYLAAALQANYWVTPNPSFELYHTPTNELYATPTSIYATTPFSYSASPLIYATSALSYATPPVSYTTSPFIYATPLFIYATPPLSYNTCPLGYVTPPSSDCPMPKSQQSWVRSQHPPTKWNLRGGRWSSGE